MTWFTDVTGRQESESTARWIAQEREFLTPRIEVPTEEIAAFCRRNHIRRLALFGSVLRDDFTPDSDVDVLVEFEPTAQNGLHFFGLEEELTELLGRKVDLCTPGFLSEYFRDEVMAEAEPIYVAPPG